VQRLIHRLPPVYDEHSRFLILGTMPSPKSRETGFYYGNPQNRMWKILETVFGDTPGSSIETKRRFLLDHQLAMWDVLAECDIEGAADSSIKNPVANNFTLVFEKAKIAVVYTTGNTAYKLYNSLCAEKYSIPCRLLPSPSPANCAVKFEKLVEAYSVLKGVEKP
jgi:hypoxanthine-DNA glycosylase